MLLYIIIFYVSPIQGIFLYSSSQDRLASQYFDEDRDDEKHDVVAYITHPGASGYAYLAQLCSSSDNSRKYSMNNAYGSSQCNNYEPPERIDCTPTNRVVLTAEVMYISSYYNLLLVKYVSRTKLP